MNEEINKLKEILENHEARIKSLENRIPGLKSEDVTSMEGKIDFERLAQKAGLNSQKIRELYDIEDNTLTLLRSAREGETEKTKEISLLVLLGYKHLLGNEYLLASELRRNVAANRVSVNNFATYLNEIIPSMILRKGKRGSRKTTYKLTALGEANAKDMLKKLCE